MRGYGYAEIEGEYTVDKDGKVDTTPVADRGVPNGPAIGYPPLDGPYYKIDTADAQPAKDSKADTTPIDTKSPYNGSANGQAQPDVKDGPTATPYKGVSNGSANGQAQPYVDEINPFDNSKQPRDAPGGRTKTDEDIVGNGVAASNGDAVAAGSA